MADSLDSVPRLLDALRRGDPSAASEILLRYQPWLRLLARLQVDSHFQGKFDASDIVQQALLEACRALPQFRGQTEAELTAWLRQILAHVLAHEIRRYRGTRQRDVLREVPLEQALAQSSQRRFIRQKNM
jgi:RNA polymerase sigma-70 factor (ECF subfamily)